MSYDNTDHHVEYLQATASVEPNDSEDYITAVSEMNDNDGNQASLETINGGVIATSTSDIGFVSKSVTSKQTISSFEVDFDKNISDSAVLLTDFHVHYESNKDHHLKTVGAGCSGWTNSASNPKQVVLNNAYAFMSDNSGHSQDDSRSAISLVVLA